MTISLFEVAVPAASAEFRPVVLQVLTKHSVPKVEGRKGCALCNVVAVVGNLR